MPDSTIYAPLPAEVAKRKEAAAEQLFSHMFSALQAYKLTTNVLDEVLNQLSSLWGYFWYPGWWPTTQRWKKTFPKKDLLGRAKFIRQSMSKKLR